MEEGKQDHFWDHTQAASTCIVDIDEQGASIHGRDHDGYRHVPVVKNAWAHIIRAYFPSRAAVPRGRRYATEYRPGPERAVVARALEGPGPAPPGQPPERCTAGRDRLWAVCGAAPGGDAPAGWAALMGEALGGLGRARGPGAEGGPRKVFFVLAMGMLWLPFVYDPTAAPSRSGLFFLKGDGEEPWRVDNPHVFVIPTETLPRQRHFRTRQDGATVVNTRDAYTLEWWSGLEGFEGTPRNIIDLTLLEEFFAVVQGAEYTGINPSSISSHS